MILLTENEINAQLASLTGWTRDGNHIEKKYVFHDFKETLANMVQMGIEAEKMNHHPDWSNVYNKLHVKLSTHDAGGITEKDFALAKKMEEIAR